MLRTLLALTLLAAPLLAAAEPDKLLDGPLNALRPGVETTRYPVSGDELSDLPGQFKGPATAEGKATAGSATPSLGHSAETSGSVTAAQSHDCRPPIKYTATVSAKVTWSLDWTILLPEWTDSGSASAAAQAEWERFLKALRVHEEGHVTVGNKAFEDAKPTTDFGPFAASDCDPEKAQQKADAQLTAAIQAEFERLSKAINDAGEKYDKDTNHGATQGATLNTGIK